MKTNVALQLHYAARRYCNDRYAFWWQATAELTSEGDANSEKVHAARSRWRVLHAILIEVERLDPDNLPSLSELSELLIIAGQVADSPFLRPPLSEAEAAAIREEQERFVQAVRSFTPEALATVPPLPYRRVLSRTEVASLWDRVQARWGTRGEYFYPVAESTDETLRAFDAKAFDEAFPPKRLQDIARSLGVERLYELREGGDESCRISVDWWEPYYNGLEGFWFSEGLNWILYASHEGSITTGGKLTDIIRVEWKDADQHPWVPFAPPE